MFMVNNADDMDKLMTMGNRNRSIGATNMNALSSRSHAIFSITVECSEKTVGNTSFPNVTVIFLGRNLSVMMYKDVLSNSLFLH